MHDSHRPVAAEQLRELATWYRDFAERAGSTTVWEARLRMAEDLEMEARRMASARVPVSEEPARRA